MHNESIQMRSFLPRFQRLAQAHDTVPPRLWHCLAHGFPSVLEHSAGSNVSFGLIRKQFPGFPMWMHGSTPLVSRQKRNRSENGRRLISAIASVSESVQLFRLSTQASMPLVPRLVAAICFLSRFGQSWPTAQPASSSTVISALLMARVTACLSERIGSRETLCQYQGISLRPLPRQCRLRVCLGTFAQSCPLRALPMLPCLRVGIQQPTLASCSSPSFPITFPTAGCGQTLRRTALAITVRCDRNPRTSEQACRSTSTDATSAHNETASSAAEVVATNP